MDTINSELSRGFGTSPGTPQDTPTVAQVSMVKIDNDLTTKQKWVLVALAIAAFITIGVLTGGIGIGVLGLGLGLAIGFGAAAGSLSGITAATLGYLGMKHYNKACEMPQLNDYKNQDGNVDLSRYIGDLHQWMETCSSSMKERKTLQNYSANIATYCTTDGKIDSTKLERPKTELVRGGGSHIFLGKQRLVLGVDEEKVTTDMAGESEKGYQNAIRQLREYLGEDFEELPDEIIACMQIESFVPAIEEIQPILVKSGNLAKTTPQGLIGYSLLVNQQVDNDAREFHIEKTGNSVRLVCTGKMKIKGIPAMDPMSTIRQQDEIFSGLTCVAEFTFKKVGEDIQRSYVTYWE
ncbi:MAG: hypothetical protein HY860_06285 [Chlamydiales bacterium]|nr:hypothetical protein [Chlamydiales bacterium]